MRLAVLILGIMVGLLAIIFGFIFLLADTEALDAAGVYGRMLATYFGVMLLWAVGIAFVIPWPKIATGSFLVAMVLALGSAFATPSASAFGGFLVLWALASLGFAVMSAFGAVGKRRAEQHARAQQDRMERLLAHRR